LFAKGSQENKAVMEDYADAMGLSELKGYKVTNYKRGGDVEYEYIDENNEKQTKIVTQEEIAAKMASVNANKELEK
jgi:hypothetical protein